MFYRYKTFELFFKDISQLFDSWDRTQGTIYRQPSPSEKSEHDEHLAIKKPLKKQTEKIKAKEKQQEKNDEKAKELEVKEKQQLDENVRRLNFLIIHP